MTKAALVRVLFCCCILLVSIGAWVIAHEQTGIWTPKSAAPEFSTAPAGTTQIAINPPQVFNYKRREEILDLRKKAVAAYAPKLGLTRYEPSNEIFHAVVDGKPWWGTAGAAVYGSGMKSILGPAEESRFILNPYLIVGANSATNLIWDPSRITSADIDNPNFPFFWMPATLMWDAQGKHAWVTYDVSSYTRAINQSGKLEHHSLPTEFSLVAYNARDLGYSYIWLDTLHSPNVRNNTDGAGPVHINQFIHCGGTCGYPGGCNNMSPFTAEIDRLQLIGLPAEASVKLWKDRPYGPETDADFTVTLSFK